MKVTPAAAGATRSGRKTFRKYLFCVYLEGGREDFPPIRSAEPQWHRRKRYTASFPLVFARTKVGKGVHVKIRQIWKKGFCAFFPAFSSFWSILYFCCGTIGKCIFGGQIPFSFLATSDILCHLTSFPLLLKGKRGVGKKKRNHLRIICCWLVCPGLFWPCSSILCGFCQKKKENTRARKKGLKICSFYVRNKGFPLHKILVSLNSRRFVGN